MPFCFALDVLCVLAGAWLGVRASLASEGGRGEQVSAWLLQVFLWVAGAGVVLGVFGGFGQPGFLLCHLTGLAALMVWRRKDLVADVRAFAVLWTPLEAEGPLQTWTRRLEFLLATSLLLLLVLALVAQPATLDAFSYHLPRSAHWLQEGRVGLIGAADTRLDFVAVQSDVLVSWVLSGLPSGYGLSLVPQALAGLLLVSATFGLARLSGLGRQASLLACFLVLGMGNVAVQFSAAQSDMLVAGATAGSVLLLVSSLRRGRISFLAACGFGLALGAKGTLFYLAPALLLWAFFFGRRHLVGWRAWAGFALVGAFAVLVFAGPNFLRNRETYGDAFGPAYWVKKVHVRLEGPAQGADKLHLNLRSSLIQALEPGSQPPGLGALSGALGMELAAGMPVRDPFSFEGRNRRQMLESVLSRRVPDADTLGPGLVSCLLFSLGLVLSLLQARLPTARLMLVWALGALLFLLYYHLMQQWHPFGFRYFVLIAPWLAIPGAWWLEQVSGRRLAWVGTLVVVLCLCVTWRSSVEPHQSGWRSAVAPERSQYSSYEASWRTFIRGLDHPENGLLVLLPDERLLSALYRQEPARRVSYAPASLAGVASAEACLQGRNGWLLAPASLFLGHEGHVHCETWLEDGAEGAPFSLAAYRLLEAGEAPAPVLYRDRQRIEEGRQVLSALVRCGQGGLELRLENPSDAPLLVDLYSPEAHSRGTLEAKAELSLPVRLPSEGVSELRVTLARADGQPLSQPVAGWEWRTKGVSPRSGAR